MQGKCSSGNSMLAWSQESALGIYMTVHDTSSFVLPKSQPGEGIQVLFPVERDNHCLGGIYPSLRPPVFNIMKIDVHDVSNKMSEFPMHH